jgi:5''-3'' exonuclease (including N-terminal domain of PolI)
MDYMKAKTEEEQLAASKKLLQTSTGVHTNGVFAMVKYLINLLEKQKPTHLVVAWDITRDTFRRKLYDGYKAQRAETRAELKSQFILMQDLLRRMNISQFMYSNYEADDIVGTLSKRFGSKIETYILTKDQDCLQLVDEYTRLWLIRDDYKDLYKHFGLDIKMFNVPDKVFEMTPLHIKELYRLDPAQIVDKKALEGDSSDNIIGCPGIGPASAVPLLQEYYTVEGVYEAIEGLSKKEEALLKEHFKLMGIKRSPLSYLLKESDTMLVGKEAALLSKKLATINTKIPELENVQLDELRLNINSKEMERAFAELEFKSLVGKYHFD